MGNARPSGTSIGAIGVFLGGLTVATGTSAAMASSVPTPVGLAGGSLITVLVIFAPPLIRPGTGKWRSSVETRTARVLIGTGIAISVLGLTTALLALTPILTVVAAALMAGYTLGTLLAITRPC